MTVRRSRSIRQHATHARLIGHGEPGPARPADPPALDAIIVPATRPAHNLEHAIALAQAMRCDLVILSSRGARTADVNALLRARSFSRATVVEIPRRYSHPLFDFETTGWVKQRFPARDYDLSVKRNVGLVLARMLGWEHIFFLDDDIRGLEAAALADTVALLHTTDSAQQPYRSAGILAPDFPDNSVVCHARRAIGEFQDVFVSGSALAVSCTASFAFFPDIYNEDWLFFYRDAAESRLGSSRYKATQLCYEPFANPLRAAKEEFGDVIAEGLYALLEQGQGAECATVPQYWHQFLAGRKEILDEIIEKSDKAPESIREKMTRAVGTARACLEEINPGMCVEYMTAWLNDLRLWGDRRDMLPRVDSIGKALYELRLCRG